MPEYCVARRGLGASLSVAMFRISEPLRLLCGATRIGMALMVCAVGLCAAPAGAAERTPDGPASLMNRWTGAVAAVLTSPGVLTGLRVTVSGGGSAGTVRAQGMAADRTDPWSPIDYEEAKVGPPATLPAAPGVYTIPAPRVHTG